MYTASLQNEFDSFSSLSIVARTPQQNGVVERKNITVQEATRIMLNQAKLLDSFWREAVYTLNKGELRVNKDKTHYKLWYGRLASVKYFKVFGSNCYIKRNKDDLGKFDSRNDEGIYLGYSSTKKEYRCYNKRLHKIVESADVKVDDIKPRKEKILTVLKIHVMMK